ncbi:MAG: ferric reductase-like transmembrane domain-containing protein [Propionibacteriaceae bacterium]|nr:ferric reductase-like transmembrane domain-containing protein [Propionibacteriaceae bacterium]
MKRAITVLGAILAVTVAAWAVSTPTMTIQTTYRVAQVFAASGMVGLACVLFISTRHPWVDRLVRGQDKAYVLHKWLAMTSLALVLIHIGLMALSHASMRGTDLPMIAHIGGPAMAVFVLLILIALLGAKLDYQRWKLVHKFMVVPYGMGLVHYYGSSTFSPFGITPLSIWMDVVALLGLASAAYSFLFLERAGTSHAYAVVATREVAPRCVEITARPGGAPVTSRPGQFVFVRVPARGFPSHPFTLAGTGEDGQIQMCVRALGDHTTRLIDQIQVGDEMRVSRAYGGFDHTTGGTRQVWIAGGIGITPFLSFLRAGVPDTYQVHLFYAFHGEDQCAYRDELLAMASERVVIHVVDDTVDGFVTPQMVTSAAGDAGDLGDVFFCGPAPMRESLRRPLLAAGARSFHYEQFRFGRGL